VYHPSGRTRHGFPVDFFAEATREDVAAETWLVPEFVDDDGQFLMRFHTFVVDAGEASLSSSAHAPATRRTVR
jgi:hypothetical protein